MRTTLKAALAASAIMIAGAASAVTIFVPNGPATGAAGVTLTLPVAAANDSVHFTVSDTAFLQTADTGPMPSYGVNAAGVPTTVGLNSGYPGFVGNALTDGTYGFTYGALVATLTTLAGSQSVQVFAANAANGLGAATPPAKLTYFGTLGSLFGAFAAGPATINFRVDDTGYADNAGQFVITSVPEAATWAMMIVGFGLAGVAMRRRATTLAA